MTAATEAPATKWISKRQARNLFRAAKYNEQEMYPRADAHLMQHGQWPADYLAAKAETARAFGVFLDAGICSGITIAASTAKED